MTATIIRLKSQPKNGLGGVSRLTSEVPRCQHVVEADSTKKLGTNAVRNHYTPATRVMVSTGDRMPFRFAYLTRFKLLDCRYNASCTIPGCTRERLRCQMFSHERDHRIHGLHHFRKNIIEIEVVTFASNKLLFTLHPVVEFPRLFGDQGAIRRKD